MKSSKGFQVDWYSGASAQLELLPPKKKVRSKGKYYDLKYTSPFRATIRPPIEQNYVGTPALEQIGQELDKVTSELSTRAAKPSSRSGVTRTQNASLENMRRLGAQLFQQLVPRRFHSDLRSGGLFLEVGLDEELLNYPWELMHDGADFLCLKHYFGRFVNTSRHSTSLVTPRNWSSESLEKLSVLVVSVPDPHRDDGAEYDRLPGAESETIALCDTLDKFAKKGVEFRLIKDENATYNTVWDALEEDYAVIHFIGHATYDDADPLQSGLVLHDRDMTSMEVAKAFGSNPPVLCFMNACETGKTSSTIRQSRQNIYGLAEAFLRSGTYLIGSRWKLGDKAAVSFSNGFYSSLLGDQKPIGEAIAEARNACKNSSPDDPFSWASYVFYGDPRLCFRGPTNKRR
jgi:CHAT domain-containing protein